MCKFRSLLFGIFVRSATAIAAASFSIEKIQWHPRHGAQAILVVLPFPTYPDRIL
jgi:hypothetical protein